MVTMVARKGKGKLKASSKELPAQFGERTSMHGIGRVLAQDTSLCERIFWGCLVVGLSGWALQSVVSSIKTYLDHPVSTVVTQKFSPPLRFPGVTFCNMNRMRKSKMSNTTLEIINAALSQSTTETRVVMIRRLKGLLDSLPRETAIAAGHSASDMLVGCMFDSSKCEAVNFTTFFNPVYGNCFTFGSNLLTLSYAGRNTGLTLDLNAQVEEYTPLTTSLGIRIILHDPRTRPFPEDDGFTVTTGQVTSIGFREKRVENLPHPYSDCLENGRHPERNMFGDDSELLYNSQSCIRSNFQKKLMQVCGCCCKWYPCNRDILRQITLENTNAVNENNSTLYCEVPNLEEGSLNRSASACYLRILAMIERLDLAEGCPAPCSITLYQTTISASYLARKDLLAYERQFHPDLPASDHLQKHPSIVRVELYFQDVSTELITSVPAYDRNKLLGDIGGQLGLLLGFSLVTAVEVLELLALLMTSALRKLLGQSQVGSSKLHESCQEKKEDGNHSLGHRESRNVALNSSQSPLQSCF